MQASVTHIIDYCDECPNLIRGRLKDYCNITDRHIPDQYFKREVPEWCPCLIKE
jgi:hypothetical protein